MEAALEEAVDFHVVHDNDSMMEDSQLVNVGPQTVLDVEFGNIMMDTVTEEIELMHEMGVSEEYHVSGSDMPVLGGEEEVHSSGQNMGDASNADMIELSAYIQPQPEPAARHLTVTSRPVSVTSQPVRGSAYRPVPIAPKPPALEPSRSVGYKPLTMLTNNKHALVKKVSLGGVLQGAQSTAYGKLGKQLVMMPAGSGQPRLKLVQGSLQGSVQGSVQYIKTEPNQQGLVKKAGSKPVHSKVLVQGEAGAQKPTVLAKLVHSPGGSTATRYYTLPSQMMGFSPTKQAGQAGQVVRVQAKPRPQQIITVKTPPKMIPATNQGKKVVISTNPGQSVLLRTANATQPTTQRSLLNTNNVAAPQANKGVQYIRLVTNSKQQQVKTGGCKPGTVLTLPSKSLLLTDTQGTLIQMSTEKQKPHMVLAGGAANINKLTSKPQQRLVRIAPVPCKPQKSFISINSAGHVSRPTFRSGQSILAPLSPPQPKQEHSEDKASLQRLLQGSFLQGAPVGEQRSTGKTGSCVGEVLHVEFDGSGDQERLQSPMEQNESMDSYDNQDDSRKYIQDNNGQPLSRLDPELRLQQPDSPRPQSAENDMNLSMRQRKACNCTKSQCLKLYCDCFANGEFCHGCNCNNCHNNLENEQLRQKAIRGCLERNPNAFRPKIGKAKSTQGPEPVRRHNKGCNCKRSGCLKNYCECYEAKIACTAICKCVGCRNVEDSLENTMRQEGWAETLPQLTQLADLVPHYRRKLRDKQPCSFMTDDVIAAVCQCLLAAAVDKREGADDGGSSGDSKVKPVLEEFSKCLQDIISASRQNAQPTHPTQTTHTKDPMMGHA